jgi:hypothetical protein
MPWRNLLDDTSHLHFISNLPPRPLAHMVSRFGWGGTSQCRHLTALFCGKLRHHPGRGASCNREASLNTSRSIPCSPAQRSRHRRTVSTLTPNSLAICALEDPWAAANTMRARSTTYCSLRWRLMIWSNLSCSFSLRTIAVARFGIDDFFPFAFSPMLSWMFLCRNVLVSLMVDIPASAGSNEIERCVQEAGRQAMREATQQAVRAREGLRKTCPYCGSEVSLPNAVWEKASAKRRANA